MGLDDRVEFDFEDWKLKNNAPHMDRQTAEDLAYLLDDPEDGGPGLLRPRTARPISYQPGISRPIDKCTPEVKQDALAARQLLPAKEASKSAICTYSFLPTDICEGSSEELLSELEMLVGSVRNGAEYSTVRQRYCSLSIALNEKGVLAPAFRPYPAIPSLASSRTPVHMTLLRDRIVIDCHWLHFRHELVKVTREEAQWIGLLALDRPFDWVRVSAFAATGINAIHRADSLLYLSIRQQCQMLALKGADVAERAARLFRGNRLSKSRTPPAIVRIRQAINRWCEKDKRVLRYEEKYLAYATSLYLLGVDRTILETAELAGFILGEAPLSESGARSTIAKLLRRLPELAPHPVASV